MLSQASPEKEKLPPLPRCPAPCSGYVRRKVLEDYMTSYFFQGPSQDGHRRKRFVLHGLGGSGKTQGALNFIDANFYSLDPEQRRWILFVSRNHPLSIKPTRFSEAYWVDATTVETITKSLEDIALSVGMSKAEDTLTLLASLNAKSNWIMLYNNADDPTLDLTKHFPKCTHGNIIVTTRNCGAARYGLGPGSDYTVSGMEYDEAKELFMDQARLFDTNSATMQVVDQLIAELSYFPLSVRQSGAYIFATSSTPAEYLDRFQTRRKQMLRKHDKMSVEDYQYGTVEATISLSFARLSPAAQRLLQLFAWFHREYILEKILQDGFSGLRRYKRYYRWLATKDEKRAIASLNQFRENLISGGRWDIDKLRGLLTELKSFSLVISIPKQRSYSIHMLVQEWTRSAIDKATQELVRGSTNLILGSAIGSNQTDTIGSLSFLRGLAPHVDELLRGGKDCFDGCKAEFGAVYKQIGRWSDEMKLRKGYNETCQKILGQQHLKSLISMHDLALTFHVQGKYEKVAEILSDVLEISKVKLGFDHPDTLSSMNSLAVTYRHQEKYEKAAEMHSDVLEILTVKLGFDHPTTLISMNNLAETYQSQGKYEKAAEMHSDVLEISKVKLGFDHPTTLISMNNLAETYRFQGKYEKVVEMQSKVLETRKVKLGFDHPDTLISMNGLAMTYRSQGKYEKAAEMHSDALEISKVKLGFDYPNTLISMNNLAVTYHFQGKYEKAAEILFDVLEIHKVKLGVDHLHTLNSMNNLAFTHLDLHNLDKAAELFSQLIELQTARFGVDHPKTQQSIQHLQSVLRLQRKVIAPAHSVPASSPTEHFNVQEFSFSPRITPRVVSATSTSPIALQPISIPNPAVQEPSPQPSFADHTPTPEPSTPIAGRKTNFKSCVSVLTRSHLKNTNSATYSSIHSFTPLRPF